MDKDIKTILTLLTEGHVPAEIGIEIIADACGIEPQKLLNSLVSSPSAKKAKQNSIKFSKWSADDESFALEAWNRGDSIGSIADHLNRTKAAIRGRLAIMQKNGHEVAQRRPATQG